MDSYFALTIVKLLLKHEGHISYRTLERQLSITGSLLEEIKQELIQSSGFARDENGLGLVSNASSHAEALDNNVTSLDKNPSLPIDVSSQRLPEAERRQLTVMFCDLVGSTALSTRLDPEDLRDVMSSFQDTCRVAIKRYDGFIARYMGDGMLVYFGYPQAHEDDAERAIRSGLEIVESMSALNSDVCNGHDVMLAVRVGVATGPVVVGDMIGEGVAEEAAVVGETPNLAARLQSVAQPNQVVISPSTHYIVGDLFTFADLGTYELKGIAEATRVWRAIGAADTEDRHESRRKTGSPTLIGRQEELGLLKRSWATSKDGHGQVVLVQGEAGVGKSRLLEALRQPLVDDDYIWVSIRCSPYHVGTPLYPVIEHLKRVMDWQPEDDTLSRLDKLETTLRGQSMPLEDIVPLIAGLMSLPLPEGRYPVLAMTPKQERDATLDAIVGWLLELAQSNPVLQVCEDLHWADPSTLELLGLYIEQSPTVPILNVLTYRPEFVPPWTMRSHMTPITLNRLNGSDVADFVTNLAGGKTLPSEVLEHIIAKSDGVPLYAEELTKTILQSGLLHEEATHYVLSGMLEDMQIPSTLQDSLMARLDRVPTVRELAQLGAVIGREFGYDMLHLLASQNEDQIQRGLEHLVDGELLYQRGRGQRARYVFKHALIQDAAYQSLLRRSRQNYHQQIAGLLEKQFCELGQVRPELIAHHYTEAGITEKAIQFWTAAGERAREQSANMEAMSHLSKGLVLLDALPVNQQRAQQELQLQLSLGYAAIVAKGHGATEAAVAFARAGALCEQLGDVPEIVPSLFGLWRFNLAARSLEEAHDVARQLGRLAERRAETERVVLADYARGCTAVFLGQPSIAHQHLHHGITHYSVTQRHYDLYRAGQDPGVACRAYDTLALWLLGFPDQARKRLNEAVALAEELDDDYSLSFTLCLIATVFYVESGDRSQLRIAADRGVHLATERRYVGWVAIGRAMQSWAAFQSERTESALDRFKQAITHTCSVGLELTLPYFKALEARACQELGRPDEGIRALHEAKTSATARSEHWWDAEIERLHGELLLAQSAQNSDRAHDCFEHALAVARRQQAQSLKLRASISRGRLFARLGDAAAGCECIAESLNGFCEGYGTTDIKAARSFLEDHEFAHRSSD